MRKFIITIILLCICFFLYGHYIEVNNLKVNNYTIENSDIPESFEELKIVHFSDILYNGNEEMLEKVVEKINSQNADIVIFSGDLLNTNVTYTEEDIELLTTYFSDIEASLFKFAVIGDEDESNLEIYKDILYESDFTLLDNESKLVFYKDNTPINVIGLTDTSSIEELLISDVEYNYTLVIIHTPDSVEELSNYDIDTIFSGHSLGGVINIPFYGGLIQSDGASTYIDSYYTVNNTEIYISNGIGYKSFAYRLFNTPSINVYKFKKI